MAVFAFDVGETLVDESRLWARIAADLDVPAFTFFAVFGALIEQDRPHREIFEVFGVDADRYLAARDGRDNPADGVTDDDLYPDAVPTLRALVAEGHAVGLAANQPERAAVELERLGLPISFLATSAGWGVAKPDPAFFERLIAAAGAPAGDIVYVGDRLDNDVLPAKRAGMTAVLVRRGPWGHLHSRRPEALQADRIIDGLDELLDEPE